ncbi:MAG: tRNA (cytidine(34)-2'-O)-methyltransferase [Bacteroides sp.]|nr:tRNA (cytidine(34)-2'-O)-methyltransferase [Bacteroides sp.]
MFKEVIPTVLNIVLVEPQIPQNTGNIARTCAVTGARLHLVKPLGFSVDDRKLKHAGLDYWRFLDISYYESLTDFFDKSEGECFYYSTKALNTYCEVEYPDNCCIIFGREDKGLPEELLYRNRERCVRIPMTDEARSLNLSNSVAVGAYEVLRQWGFPELKNKGSLTKYVWRPENNT